MQNNLEISLQNVKQRISAYELKYAREPGSVQLLAVSKTQAAERIREAFHSGQQRFAENYVQEALVKMAALADCNIEWHFIGPIQSNKTRDLAENFNWVHSVDRLKIAQRLNEQRPLAHGPLNILLQVNLSHETSKAGVDLAQLPTLAAAIAPLANLRLGGLMAIPAIQTDFVAQRQLFRQLAVARDQLLAGGHPHCRALSMGMSTDFEAAIAEGATFVRIGTDIFGSRKTVTMP